MAVKLVRTWEDVQRMDNNRVQIYVVTRKQVDRQEASQEQLQLGYNSWVMCLER